MNGTDGTQGAVYCVTNPTMQELVKIGLVEKGDANTLSKRVKNRIDGLYGGVSSIPVPFDLYYAVAVDDPRVAEKRLHDTFRPYRKNDKREFFEVTPHQVMAAMKLTGGEEVTITDAPNDDPDVEVTQADIDARERAQAWENNRLSNFKFSMVNIPPGETITYFRDSNITATVHDAGNKILFEGEVMSTSGAAGIILERRGFSRDSGAPSCWEYDGETLHDRRSRMAAEKTEREQ